MNLSVKYATFDKDKLLDSEQFRKLLLKDPQKYDKQFNTVYPGRFSVNPWITNEFLMVGFSSVFFLWSAFVLFQAWRRSKEVAPGRL